jgi:FHA domain
VAKIILTDNGVVLQEMPLLKERVTIGRRPHNDIVIDGPAISGEHAVIVTVFNDSILEDLNSTNGTQINGQPVKKHFLQDNDVIELAQYKLRYVAEARQEAAAAESLKTPPAGPSIAGAEVQPDHDASPRASGTPTAAGQAAVIKILDGHNAGKLIVLAKALTTIGRPGAQVAVIARAAEAYSITHVEGDTYPLLNGECIGAGAHRLADGDVIDLSGTRMEFALG